jgi:hypothetical protein
MPPRARATPSIMPKTIFADNDRNYVGQDAAYCLARRCRLATAPGFVFGAWLIIPPAECSPR